MLRSRWLAPVALILLSVALVGTMWVVPYLPTNDGPEWVFATHAENRYGDPAAGYQDLLVPEPQFASRGFGAVYGAFEAWLGWQRGLQVALSVVVLLVAWAFVALVRELSPERWALGLLGFPLALSWGLYMGLWAFVVSSGIGVFVLALAVRLREPTWRGRAVLSLLLLVQAVAHVFGAVIAGAALALLWLARAPRGKRLAELGRTVVTGLPAAGILVACVVVSRHLDDAPFARGFERFPWRDVARMLPATIVPGPFARALVVTVGVAVAAVVAAVRVTRTDTDAADRGLGLAAVVLLLTAVFAPFQIPGWQAFSPRFLPMGVALAVAVVPLERLGPAMKRLAPPVCFAAALGSLALSYPFHRRLADLCPDAIAGLTAPVHLKGEILPVRLRPTELPTFDRVRAEVPLMWPLLHMGTLYAAAHGGSTAYSFTGPPSIYPFMLRPRQDPRPLPDLEHYLKAIASLEFHRDLGYRRQVEGELASSGMFYDEVAVFGALPEDLAVWSERGYVADWHQGSALLAHFEPCTIDFAAPPVSDADAPLFDVRVGKLGLLDGVRAPGVAGDDGLTHFFLTPAPCGVVAVRPRWKDGGAGRACRNANPRGEIVARVTRTERRVACEPP